MQYLKGIATATTIGAIMGAVLAWTFWPSQLPLPVSGAIFTMIFLCSFGFTSLVVSSGLAALEKLGVPARWYICVPTGIVLTLVLYEIFITENLFGVGVIALFGAAVSLAYSAEAHRTRQSVNPAA